jgi:hypothetical protein
MGRESPEVAQANRSSDDFHTAAIRKEEATVTKTEADAQGGWDSDEPITTDAQAGVQQIEATTNVWTKGALIFAYVWIWIICESKSLSKEKREREGEGEEVDERCILIRST